MSNQAIKAYPLQWPLGWERTTHRRSSTYKVTTDAALEDLFSQVRLLGGRDVVVSSNVPVRLDGTMYRNDHSDRALPDPGVAVYWTARDKRGNPVPRVIPCDHWRTPRENVRAIGMALRCMRGLKICGAGEIQDRAFDGFKALPSGEDPWSVLGLKRTATREQINDRLRELSRTEHPDRGGSADRFAQITRAAREALEATP